jgi:Mg-chelatase subunit ChlD/DNA-binding beta-propeller fold protein YncE
MVRSVSPLLVRAAPIAVLGCLMGASMRVAAQQPGPVEAYSRIDLWSSSPIPPPPTALRDPSGVTVDAFDGAVFLADSGNDRVQVFGPDGTFVRTIGGSGAPEALSRPSDVAVQGSVVFVSDTGNDRVALFTVEGEYVGEWPGLAQPWGIASAADGRVAVLENGAGRVSVFRADGQTLATWELGSTSLRGADFTPDGRLAVADAGSAVVRLLDENGDEVRSSQTLSGPPQDVAAAPDGYLYVTIEDQALVRLQNGLDLPEVRRWTHAGAWGVAAGPGGAVYTTFRDDDRPLHGVQKWSGSPLAQTEVWGDVPAPLGVLDDPSRIAAWDLGLVLDSWRRVQRIDQSGQVIDQIPTGAVNDVTALGTGGMVVARDASVSALDSSGAELWRFPVPPAVGEYAWVVAVAHDPASGRTAALDIGRQRLWILDEAGQAIDGVSFRPGPGLVAALWDIAPAPGGWFVINRRADTLEWRDPTGRVVTRSWTVPGGALRVASDQRGNVFVLNRLGWVWKLDVDANLLAVWRAGDPADDSSRPYDLAVDAADRVLVLDRGLERVEVYGLDQHGDPGEVPTFDPGCAAQGDKFADPTRLFLGEETEITLEIGGDCPSVTQDVDVILVIDVSGSMSQAAVAFPGTKLEAAQNAATSFLSLLDFGQFRVGVVAFNQQAQLVAPLTELLSTARGAIGGLVAAGGTDIAAGVDVARAELTGSRRRLAATGVVVLLTDGFSDPLTAQRAADQAKLEGVRIFTIGFGDMVASDLLLAIASAPTDFYLAPTGPELVTIYAAIAERISAQVLFSTLTVVDELPPNMTYVPGSGIPPPTVTTTTLTWVLADVPMAGTSLTYRVEPQVTGEWPTNVFAVGEGTDGLGQPGRVSFPVPEVVVVAPTGTPPATPTPTETATPRATSLPKPLYLPAVRDEACLRRRQHVDVVLVVDTSTSMQDSTAAGRTKLEAAQDAASQFLGMLALDGSPTGQDRAALVWFNNRSGLGAPMGATLADLRHAIDGLPVGAGTRIDLGLARAADVLAHEPSANRQVTVLLTDGRPTDTTPGAVIDAGRQLTQAGVVIYAIGLGADVDPDLLAAVANDPARVVLAPDGEALAEIYAQIARELPCVVP